MFNNSIATQKQSNFKIPEGLEMDDLDDLILEIEGII